MAMEYIDAALKGAIIGLTLVTALAIGSTSVAFIQYLRIRERPVNLQGRVHALEFEIENLKADLMILKREVRGDA